MDKLNEKKNEQVDEKNLSRQQSIEKCEEILKEIEDLLNCEPEKNAQKSLSESQKQAIKALLEKELASCQKSIEGETQKQKSLQNAVKTATKSCKHHKVADFLKGALVGEVSGIVLGSAKSLSETSLETCAVAGAVFGVVLGYAIYLKNRNDHNLLRDREVEFANKKLKTSTQTKIEYTTYKHRCQQELDLLSQ